MSVILADCSIPVWIMPLKRPLISVDQSHLFQPPYAIVFSIMHKQGGTVQVAFEVCTLVLLGGNFVGMGRVFEKIEMTPHQIEEQSNRVIEWMVGGALLLGGLKLYVMLSKMLASQENFNSRLLAYEGNLRHLNSRVDDLGGKVHTIFRQQVGLNEKFDQVLQLAPPGGMNESSVLDMVEDFERRFGAIDLARSPSFMPAPGSARRTQFLRQQLGLTPSRVVRGPLFGSDRSSSLESVAALPNAFPGSGSTFSSTGTNYRF